MATLVSRLALAGTIVARYSRWLAVVALLLALLYPLVARAYFLGLAVEVLVYGIFAMSLDLLLGYAGLISFGHAAFFGLGAYIVAFLSSRNERALQLTSNLLVTMPAVIVGTALVAALIGFFALRTKGIYFLMVTLAFAQMLYSVAISWSRVTGGSDGLSGVPRPTLGVGPWGVEFVTGQQYYYLVLVVFFAVWWLLRRIVASPFGATLRGIRENEARLSALGYNTFRFKMAAFVLAGVLAGVAGALLAANFGIASPDDLYWTTSGEVMIMLIVGGAGTLGGPVLGAGAVRLLRNFASSYTERWESLIGLMFILFVIFAPRGLAGIWRERKDGDQ